MPKIQKNPKFHEKAKKFRKSQKDLYFTKKPQKIPFGSKKLENDSKKCFSSKKCMENLSNIQKALGFKQD